MSDRDSFKALCDVADSDVGIRKNACDRYHVWCRVCGVEVGRSSETPEIAAAEIVALLSKRHIGPEGKSK
jgi:predicted restriction endonuclease